MYISDDIVDALFVDDELGEAALDKGAHEFLGGGLLAHGLYLGAVDHAVAYAEVGEVEGILEDLDLGIYILGAVALLDARLDEVVEVHLGESLSRTLFVEFYAKYA